MEFIHDAIAQLEDQQVRLVAAIEALKQLDGTVHTHPVERVRKPQSVPRRKPLLSKAARERIAKFQRERWAKWHAAKRGQASSK